jgi:hypothetical protein
MYYSILFLLFLYDAIKFISFIIYKYIDRKKQKRYVLRNYFMITGNFKKLKFIKIAKGSKIIIEYSDNNCVFGKIRNIFFYKRIYAPLEILTEKMIFRRRIVDKISIFLRYCCYLVFALWAIFKLFNH